MNNKKPWFNFMASNEWAVFMNIMRILTGVILICIFIYIVKEVETIKLMSNACEVCIERSGCQCFCVN